MGNLHTPLTNTPVVDWTDTAVGPDVPQSMMNALGSLERYANVPVPDAPTRETLMPPAQRYIGQVTYNQATDTFEYWNGSKWQAVNRKAALPSTFHIIAGPNVVLQPGQYYDYKASITATSSNVMTLFGNSFAWSNAGPGVWGGYTLRFIHNDVVTGDASADNVFFSQTTGGGQMNLSGIYRFEMAPGTETFGIRLVCMGGNSTVQLSYVSLLGIKTSIEAGGASGPGTYGNW